MNRKPLTATERKRITAALAKIADARESIESILIERDHRGDRHYAPDFGTYDARALDTIDRAVETLMTFGVEAT